jgi:hypothetical protein
MLNPFAGDVVGKYTQSVSGLTGLYDNPNVLRDRVHGAREYFLKYEFSFDGEELGSHSLNTHVSLLAAGDQWYRHNTDLSKLQELGTPVFDMKLAMLSILYSNQSYLDSCISNAASVLDLRSDDECFLQSVIHWENIIKNRDTNGYRTEFDAVSKFLEPMAQEGFAKSKEYISKL